MAHTRLVELGAPLSPLCRSRRERYFETDVQPAALSARSFLARAIFYRTLPANSSTRPFPPRPPRPRERADPNTPRSSRSPLGFHLGTAPPWHVPRWHARDIVLPAPAPEA